MLQNKILKVVLLLLGVTFIILQGFSYEFEGAALSTLMLLLLTVLYIKYTEKKSSYFFWFLVFFAVGDILSYLSYFGPELYVGEIDYYYFAANILYISSYVLLIIGILRGLKFKKVFTEFPIPILILIVLDVFCVSIVTSTTETVLSIYEYSLEFTYNAIIMILLSVALINYMYRNDNKSMLFLIATIFIVFSEIIQLAYYYIIVDDKNLGFIYSLFLVVAFVFLYLQSQVEFTGPEPEYSDEQFEV